MVLACVSARSVNLSSYRRSVSAPDGADGIDLSAAERFFQTCRLDEDWALPVVEIALMGSTDRGCSHSTHWNW